MSIDSKIHPIQTSILKVLTFQPEARFSELNTENIPSDQFTFHVKRLLETELVEKNEKNLYQLTQKGKEFANRFDFDSKNKKADIERQAKLGVLVVCIRKNEGKKEFLFQKRLKQPYYGFHGSITGKIKWGESPAEAAARELKEETGLEADLSLAGIEHKTDHDQSGVILEDKYFFIFRAENHRGNFLEEFEGGKNLWINRDGLSGLEDVFEDIPSVLDALEKKEFFFLEQSFTVSKY